ncbi:MAG: hypothetical protein A3E87_04265 [Gammaproteobacteria bacterium RIFCSPHIGHO2_12_FULL_35_23]|nr:MAG: hypothetical protein A3E87_04265 [Gammaproteobacteria bacterium RIFCSPHIGHO2_12_FULL_35_23]
MKQELTISSVIIDESQTFTIYELSTTCQVCAEEIIEMVEYGLLTPQGEVPEVWIFSARDLRRSQKALRLQQDFQINLPGLALSLDLLEEIEQLRAELNHFKKLYK